MVSIAIGMLIGFLGYFSVRALVDRYTFDCGPWDGVHADAYQLCMAQARHERRRCDRIVDPEYQNLCYRSVRP